MNFRRVKNIAVPIVIVTTSIALTYAFLEFLVFGYVLHFLPLKTHWYLDEEIQVLAQYSKRESIPKEYIALVGDSYAAGKGVWFDAVDKDKRPDFHTAHIIYKRTGRDVITYGANGAGSLRGIIAEPISQFTLINASFQFKMPLPELIAVTREVFGEEKLCY